MHIKKVHEGQEMDSFTCDKCGEMFNSRSALARFECEKWVKIFTSCQPGEKIVHEKEKKFSM